jgi:hypothetical protein
MIPKPSDKPENSLEKAATDMLTSHVEGAVSDLASNIVGAAIEEVKNNIAPKRFMRRLTCLKERKSSSENSSV